jgi:NAD(P)-dependent dehydrogenase (short-subunit alcohol dehydrogenase family)
MRSLLGKVAIVTGGSKGIGKAIARSLLESGCDVLLCSRKRAEAEKVAAELGAPESGRVIGVGADVRQLSDVERLVETAVRELGGLDVLVANAGVGGGFGPIDEIAPEVWHSVIDTNLTGVYNCCHLAVPELKKRGGGWIVTIASLAGRYAFAGGTAYNASKFGLLGFTEALMLDVRDHGIRVSCIMPGSVDTYFNDTEPRGESWKLAPADVAQVVLQLLDHEDRSLPSRVELRPAQPKKR